MKRLLFLLLCLLPMLAAGQVKKPHVTYLNGDSLIKSKLYYNWRIHVGGPMEMANRDYNDSNWQLAETELNIYNDTSNNIKKFDSVIWFRLHVNIDSALAAKPLILTMTHLGASEIYVDGKKVEEFGVINGRDSSVYYDPDYLPSVIKMDSAGEHVIAVRYVNYKAYRNYKYANKTRGGFEMYMGRTRFILYNERSQTVAITFLLILLFGIFTALSLLHMLLYLYYKAVKSNLYFSLFSLSLGATFLAIFLGRFATTPGIHLCLPYVSSIIMSLACISLSGFSNELFSKSKLRFRILSLLSVATFLYWLTDVHMYNILGLVLIAVVTLESVVLTIVGMFRKVRGAKIVGFGLVFFGIFFLFIAITAILFDNINIDESTVTGFLMELLAMGAIVSMPVSMSVYLAWSFSAMNKDLKNQLEQIKELSYKSLEQEKEKKEILEQQNLELEQKVSERTQEVQHQKELVDIKNQAITDNLTYARRIQSAMLPDINLINKTLTQSFILYLPKDIVSGDFYSFSRRDNEILIAAGDCTGHGVSGAFMSMIGSSLLNQIINEKGIVQPGLILNSLNTAVIETLKQTQNDSNDGMDISICAINLEKKELQYAGANRPFYMVRNNLLEIIKPDKQPIGGLQIASERTFTNHTMPIQKDDTLYLFTDGYADQFGGEKGKKLMVARFKEILLSIQNLPMAEQMEYLHAHFEAWKGANEQVDDVLVIGIRL